MLKIPAIVYNLKIEMIGMQKIGIKFRKNSKTLTSVANIATHGWTNYTNLEMEPKYLTKSDV